MPRKRSKQTTIRTGAPEEIRKPQAPINARQPYVQYSRIHADRTAGQAELRMSRALAGLTRPVNDIMRRRAAEEEREQFNAGQLEAMKYANDDLEAFRQRRSEFMTGQSDAWLRGYNAQAGRALGHKALNGIRKELSENGEAMDDAQFDALIGTTVQGLTDGLDPQNDKDMIENLVNVIGRGEVTLRKTFNEMKLSQAHDIVVKDYDTALRQDLSQIAEQGGGVTDIHTTLRAYRDQALVMGLTQAEVNQYIVENVVELARRTKNPDLLDVFDMDTISIENPDKVIPGLSKSGKWGPKLDQARDIITRETTTSNSIERNKQIYELGMEIDRLAMDNDYVGANELIDQGVEDGLLTGHQGLRMRGEVAGHQQMRKQAYDLKTKVNNGDAWDLPAGERQAGVNELVEDTYEHATNPMDAHLQAARIGMVNGTMYTPHKLMMKQASPKDPNGWTQSYEVWNAYRATDPAGLINTIGAKRHAQYRHFDNLLRYMEPEDAILSMQETYSPESVARAKDLMKDPGLNREIEDRLVNNYGANFMDWDGQDSTNGDYVTDRVRENVRSHLIANPGSTVEEALEAGQEVFEAQHTRVQSTDGSDSFYWAWTGGRQLPMGFDEAHQRKVEEYADMYRGTNKEASGYHLQPNPLAPHSDIWILFNTDTGRPVRNDAGTGVETVNIMHMVGANQQANEQEAIEANQRYIEKLRKNKETMEKSYERAPSGLKGVAHEEDSPLNFDPGLFKSIPGKGLTYPEKKADKPFASRGNTLTIEKAGGAKRVPLYHRNNDG